MVIRMRKNHNFQHVYFVNVPLCSLNWVQYSVQLTLLTSLKSLNKKKRSFQSPPDCVQSNFFRAVKSLHSLCDWKRLIPFFHFFSLLSKTIIKDQRHEMKMFNVFLFAPRSSILSRHCTEEEKTIQLLVCWFLSKQHNSLLPLIYNPYIVRKIRCLYSKVIYQR